MFFPEDVDVAWKKMCDFRLGKGPILSNKGSKGLMFVHLGITLEVKDY